MAQLGVKQPLWDMIYRYVIFGVVYAPTLCNFLISLTFVREDLALLSIPISVGAWLLIKAVQWIKGVESWCSVGLFFSNQSLNKHNKYTFTCLPTFIGLGILLAHSTSGYSYSGNGYCNIYPGMPISVAFVFFFYAFLGALSNQFYCILEILKIPWQ